jgi:predicted permease
MFLEHFKVTGVAVAQIFILASLGFYLVKRKFLSEAGLDAISQLVMDVTLPVLIFAQLMRDFRFNLYPNWWIFPLISLGITVLGLLIGAVFSCFVKGEQQKLQFISLVGFQNSGYLPLALIAALLSGTELGSMFIYLFLFLMGFNLAMFSVGVFILDFHDKKKFNWLSLFSMPVVATIVSLCILFFGLNRFIPSFVIKPLRILGDSTLPLALLVVGGNLAQMCFKCIDKKLMSLLILAKMIVLPAIGILFIRSLGISKLTGLLIVIQLSMPSAVTLSVILRNYKRQDLLVSQGILLTHVASVVTLPLFLVLYFSWVMVK